MLNCPVELVEHIVTLLEPQGIAAVAQTCRLFHSIVYSPRDNHLWRGLWFVRDEFDDPRIPSDNSPGKEQVRRNFDWREAYQTRARLELMLNRHRNRRPLDLDEWKWALEVICSIMCSLPPASLGPSKTVTWLALLLADLPEPPIVPSNEIRELRARTRVYLGSFASKERHKSRCASRGYIYDFAHTTDANLWGPYKPNFRGEVNWLHMWHITNVVALNLLEIQDLGHLTNHKVPVGLEATRAYGAPGADQSSGDWAGVRGKWRRLVCFMDQHDQHMLNMPTNSESSINQSVLEDPGLREAIRSMFVELWVTSTDKTDPNSRWPNRPKIYFSGRGCPEELLDYLIIKGEVFMTPDDQIRWRILSSFGGQRWSSDGVQIGGPASKAGVAGIWSTAERQLHGPAGPFWYWKVEGDITS